ncbi:hypothetical protein [Microcystis aeruginosa]|uniref:hypothetical protein n=1 Tax=Microcystis aeruginosa TaxID=1126 RepID=UPI001EE74ECF|nr:hypothetical protein [Microcystis aeruginosa]
MIRHENLIKKDIRRFLSIVVDLEGTNQLNLLPDQDLVDLCPPDQTGPSNGRTVILIPLSGEIDQ